MSLYARLAALIVIVLAIAGAWWKFDRMLAKADAAGYERRAQEDKDAADKQTAGNRELGRLAEMHVQALATKREQFFTKAEKEIHDAAAPLATCPVPEPVRVRLNAALACAIGDSPAACDPVGQVPSP